MPGKRCLNCNEVFPAKFKFFAQCEEALGAILLGFVFILKFYFIVD